MTVLKSIKSTPSLVHIPTVVLSNTWEPEEVRGIYTAQCNCFIRKPDDLPQFVRIIEACYKFWTVVATLCKCLG